MMITTAEKAKNNDMMRIFIDNRYAFSIPHEEYIRNHLYEQEEISEEKLSDIRTNILVRAAREKAVRYLTAKDRSEGELSKKLSETGFDSDVVKRAIEALRTIGYLDDSRYALKYISERVRTKALSRKALGFELEQKGISSDIIESVLSEFETDDGEAALRAARKKFGKYDINDKKVEQKVLSFLCHRGFSFETGRMVVKRLKEG